MPLTCYSTTSPDAQDAHQLYSEDHDNGALWVRTNQSVPLSTCSSSPDALDSLCDVCTRENQVYAFCRRLRDKLVMETTGGKSITMKEIDCPVFPPDSSTDSPEAQQLNFPTGLVTTIIAVAILLFLIVVGVLLYRRRCKRGNKPEIVRREEGDAADAQTAV